MPSPFQGIDIASRALRAFQRGLDVTGHNIANANTPGYSRQVVDFQQTDPLTFYLGTTQSLGTGVTIGSINRIRDMFLENRRATVQGDFGRSSTLSRELTRAESIFTDLSGGGVSDALNAFFDSWSGLASNPSDSSMRFQVQLTGQTLAGRIQSTYGELQSLKTQIQSEMTQTFDSVDKLSAEINRLNGEIRAKVALGAEPNDLMDMRDQAIQSLGKEINIVTHQFDDGTVQVYSSQYTLVDGTDWHAVPRDFDIAANQLKTDSLTVSVKAGNLRGLFDSLNRVTSYQADLDKLANSLRTEFNAVHRTGLNNQNPPATGIDFFNDSTLGAIDFTLSFEVANDPNAIAANITGKPGDGGLALTLSQYRNRTVDALGGRTFGTFFTDLVTGIGREVSHASNDTASKQNVLDQIDVQIQSNSGVSLDDEMANMLRFQRSYQAAAKMLNVFDQVTEDLINLIRR